MNLLLSLPYICFKHKGFFPIFQNAFIEVNIMWHSKAAAEQCLFWNISLNLKKKSYNITLFKKNCAAKSISEDLFCRTARKSVTCRTVFCQLKYRKQQHLCSVIVFDRIERMVGSYSKICYIFTIQRKLEKETPYFEQVYFKHCKYTSYQFTPKSMLWVWVEC